MGACQGFEALGLQGLLAASGLIKRAPRQRQRENGKENGNYRGYLENENFRDYLGAIKGV